MTRVNYYDLMVASLNLASSFYYFYSYLRVLKTALY